MQPWKFFSKMFFADLFFSIPAIILKPAADAPKDKPPQPEKTETQDDHES